MKKCREKGKQAPKVVDNDQQLKNHKNGNYNEKRAYSNFNMEVTPHIHTLTRKKQRWRKKVEFVSSKAINQNVHTRYHDIKKMCWQVGKDAKQNNKNVFLTIIFFFTSGNR